MDDPLISIAAAAREVGVNKSTLARQVTAGLIRSHGGMVRLSEVLEDRANNIDHSMARRRKAKAAVPETTPLHHQSDATPGADASEAEDDDADGDATVFVDGTAMSLGKAKALKETYLARLRQLEFEVKSGRLIDADAARKAVFDLSRQDRDAWANWPSRVAPLIAAELGVDQVQLAVILEQHVRNHLGERAQPALRLAS